MNSYIFLNGFAASLFVNDAVTNGMSLHVILPTWKHRKSVYTEAGHCHSQDLLLLTHNGKITLVSCHFASDLTAELLLSFLSRKQLSCSAVFSSNNARCTPLLSFLFFLPLTRPRLLSCFPSRVRSSLSSPSQFILIISIGNRWSEDEGEFPAFKTRMMN